MNKFKQYALVAVWFLVLLVPMVLLAVLLSPIQLVTNLNNAIRREMVLNEVRGLCEEIEFNLHQRRMDRSEVN